MMQVLIVTTIKSENTGRIQHKPISFISLTTSQSIALSETSLNFCFPYRLPIKTFLWKGEKTSMRHIYKVTKTLVRLQSETVNPLLQSVLIKKLGLGRKASFGLNPEGKIHRIKNYFRSNELVLLTHVTHTTYGFQ